MADLYRNEVIDPGDAVSKLACQINFESHGNCGAIDMIPRQPGNFRGAVDIVPKPHILKMMMDGTVSINGGCDGAGGKPQFFTLVGTPEAFGDLPWEIITMTADDRVRFGGFPCALLNIMDIKRVTSKNFHLVEALLQGFGRALKESLLTSWSGETAVMKHSVTAFCETDPEEQLILNWGATCLGLTHRDRVIDGLKIKPGMPIVGFWEEGMRCNGGTLHTNLMILHFGPDPRDIVNNPKAIEYAKKLTVPSHSYARTVSRVHGWNTDGSVSDPIVRIAGIAHITGGGVWGKFGELLPEGVGANLYAMPYPAQVLLDAQKMSQGTPYELSDWKAYSTFHGGCGMLAVVEDQNSAERLIAEAMADGINTMVVGRTTQSPDKEIVIQSRFREGKSLSSLHPE